LQLLYNPANDLAFYRTNFAVVLGTWHPYKVANESLFFAFLPSFLGRAYHAIFPQMKVVGNPQLVHLENFVNILSCAYPTFRPNLIDLVRRTAPNSPFLSVVQNLYDLFEVFLPIVSSVLIFIFLCIKSVKKKD